MDSALDLLNWRTHLTRTSVLPSAEVVLEIADRNAAQTGEDTVALARAVCEIVQGFSPQLVSMRAGKGFPQPSSSANSIDLALEEVRVFASLFAQQLAGERRAFRNHLPLHWMPAVGSNDIGGGQVAADIQAFHTILTSDDGDAEDADALLSRLGRWCSGLGKVEIASLAFAPLPELIGALSALNLRAFLHETADLAEGAVGSVRMLRAAARFDSFGLGPYFRNVGSLVRHSRDVFELAHVACDAIAAERKPISQESCVALLARSLKGPLLIEVVDDLGDLDARTALSILLTKTGSGNPINLNMVMRLRDIALDNQDYQAAAQAQRYLCYASPDDALEHEILGSIYASLGNTLAAQQALEQALECGAERSHILKRLQALGENSFKPFTLSQGFGSPEGRRLTRQARRRVPSKVRSAETRGAVGVEFTF